MTVYLAEQRSLKRKVAIKLATAQDEDVLAAIRQEAEILASIDHPHIVSLYDLDEYEGYPYQVLGFIDGDSLRGMIESGDELPVTVALKLAIGIADALDYIHGLGIVHGDIKPANILISSGGNPFLGDFTFSGSIEDDPLRGRLVGTPEFISPETWRGNRDKRADLWSFGMTLHYLLTGRVPFPVTDAEQVRELVASEAPLDLSELRACAPEPVARIVERCLQKDLDARYPSAAEMRRDLESALAYLESGRPETAAATIPLGAGRRIWLNVEYKEPGIPGQYREYEIQQELGGGSFSVVYRARDVIGKRQVALKILRPDRADNERTLVRFQREAGLLARLNHPNVVRAYNYGRYGADFFIVLEMLEGLTIKEAAEGEFEFSIQQAVTIVAQVLAGLDVIHAQGAVHRDIAPGNVMLHPKRAVVMDLGIAHISGAKQLTTDGEIYGTPRYMAPEQIRGQKVTSQSDLYAAGVLLYELLTRRIPHEADSAASLIFKIVAEEPDPIVKYRGDLPSSLVAFTDRMLAREPAQRFQSARLAYEALLASVQLRSDDLVPIHRKMFVEIQENLQV